MLRNDESRLLPIGLVLAVTMMFCAVPAAQAAPKSTKRVMPWDVPALSKTPKVHPTKERPANGMRSFFYEGADYKGKPTWVFAYYSAPKGKPPKGGWPAVVCAHGGGGSAFPAWVRKWNSEKFAAISMDLEGHLPGGGHFGVEGGHPVGKGHQNAGPKRESWFGDIALPDNEQWFYHACADVMLANSLLRSFPEINKKKIGLTGISWGGTIVATVAGVDPRFAFVIPVYGCGYIRRHEMSDAQYKEYLAKWDPSAHLPYAKMPIFWVIGLNEPVFPLGDFCRSAALPKGPSVVLLRGFLPHGHGFGWDECWEIGGFAKGVLTGKAAIARIEQPRIDPKDGLVHAKVVGTMNGAKILYMKGDKWKNGGLPSIPARIVGGEVVASKPLPGNAKYFMVQGAAGGPWGGAPSCSPLVKVKP